MKKLLSILLLFLCVQSCLVAGPKRKRPELDLECHEGDLYGEPSLVCEEKIDESSPSVKKVRFEERAEVRELSGDKERTLNVSTTMSQLDQLIEIFEDWRMDLNARRVIGGPGFEWKEVFAVLAYLQCSPQISGLVNDFTAITRLIEGLYDGALIERYNMALAILPHTSQLTQAYDVELKSALNTFIDGLEILRAQLKRASD